MSSALRACALALFLCLAAAAPASAGQIVYNANDSIYVANDDGSGQRPLITPDDVPGASSVYYPHVSPNGETVVFSARTGVGGLYCGFSCVGVYRWDAGKITRLSFATSPCPPGDLCAGLDVDPKITADGSQYYYEQVYAEPGGQYGAPQSISTHYVAPAVFEGVRQEVELKEDNVDPGACKPADIVPHPGDGDTFAFVGCDAGQGFSSAIKVKPSGGAAFQLASDDGTIADLAWSPDGSRIADAEQGNDSGIWTVNADAGNPAPAHVLNLAWDNDHSSYNTSPAFVGNDRIAFIYGGEVRAVSAGCQGCGLGDSVKLADAPNATGLAWTARTLPVVQKSGGTTTTPGGTNQGGNGNQAGNGNAGAGQATLAPRKLKLAAALKGLAVPFKAPGAGTLALKAQLDAKTAKKLKLIKKGTKPVSVASGKATAKGAGNSTAKLKFTKTAAKRLKKAKSLKLKLVGAFTPAGGGAAQAVSATVTITR